MKRLLLASLLVACSSLFAGSAFAQAKSEDAIKYRQGVYRVMGWNFGPMAAMVKGDRPYDAAAFARYAEIVAHMSKLPLEGFVPGAAHPASTLCLPRFHITGPINRLKDDLRAFNECRELVMS
jgi:cytochrome c556